MAKYEMPRRAMQCATGAKKPIQVTAEGLQNLAWKARKGIPYLITPSVGQPFRIAVAGRTRWALDRLRMAGERGCTPITEPAPRWSAYVFNLRKLGLEIETINEAHGGDYAGHHARYVLRCHAVPQKGAAV